MAGCLRHHLLILSALHLVTLSSSRCISVTERHLYSDVLCPAVCSCHTRQDGTVVNCVTRRLTTVPDPLPDNTVELYLTDNDLKSFPDQVLANCSQLQVLDLSHNHINKLGNNALTSTTNLHELYLNDNNIHIFSLPRNIFSTVHNLKQLYMHNNVWVSAENYSDYLFDHLSRLEHLSIDGIPGACFTSGFSKLTNLLNFGVYGGIEIVTNETFAVFTESPITSLKVRTDSLRELQPLAFAHFAHLKTLDLSYNTGLGLANASNAWWGLQFTNLSDLILSRMTSGDIGVTALTDDFFSHLSLAKITKLLLDKNNVLDVQPMFAQSLPYLEHLDLSYNRIFDAPRSIYDIWHLRHVRYIDASHQVKLYEDQPQKRLDAFSHTADLANDRHSKSGNDTTEFFRTCRTPVFPPCSNVKRHPWKYILPPEGTWCLPLPPKLEVLNMSESLNVDIKYMPPLIAFGGSHGKLLEYRLNGIEKLLGPVIMTQPARQLVLDYSDNKISCISPDMFKISAEIGTVVAGLILSGNKLGAQMEADVNGITFQHYKKLSSLNLVDNGIKRLPGGVFTQLTELKVLNLSKNALRQIQFELDHMSRLHMLDISYNLLTTLETSTRGKLADLMGASNLTVNLLGNPFQCSCETYDFLKWINHHREHLVDVDDYACIYEGKIVKVLNSSDKVMANLSFKCSEEVAVIVSAILLGLALILIAVGVCCYRYRWEGRYICLKLARRTQNYQLLVDNDVFTFDAFVVYSSEDRRWVVRELVPHLENCAAAQRLRLCIHERDFMPGEYIIGGIWRRMEESRKVILVISNNFTRSNYCTYEIELARMLGVEKARNIIVPVLLENVRMEDMSDPLQWIVRRLTYLEWPEWEPDREEFWQRLRETVMDSSSI